MLQFFTDCQCIFNPSISVWVKNGTLGDFSFNIGEEHDNEFRAFVSHISFFFQFGKCWDSSVETALCEVMKNTCTVGLPPWVKSTIAFYYLGTWVNVINQCTLEASTGTPLMTSVCRFLMTILYNLVPTRMLILPYTGQRRNKVKNILSQSAALQSYWSSVFLTKDESFAGIYEWQLK